MLQVAHCEPISDVYYEMLAACAISDLDYLTFILRSMTEQGVPADQYFHAAIKNRFKHQKELLVAKVRCCA